jgi:hypothetical protein
MTEQKHFSLMAEFLDPDLPENEKIDVLAHARKEFGLTQIQVRRLFETATKNSQRAYVLNDVLTAVFSAVQRLDVRWGMEDSEQEIPRFDCPEFIEFLRAGVVPLLDPKQ